jgi:hypothetical protein
MSPKIRQRSAPICISRREQRAQTVVKADDKNGHAERLQIFRHETHPKLLARTDHKNGNEQNDEIASRTEKIREACNEAPQNDELASRTEKICEACNEAGRNDQISAAAEKIHAPCHEVSNAVHALLLPQALRLFNLRIFFARALFACWQPECFRSREFLQWFASMNASSQLSVEPGFSPVLVPCQRVNRFNGFIRGGPARESR